MVGHFGSVQRLSFGCRRRNVQRVVRQIRKRSGKLDGLAREGQIAIVVAMYDVSTGKVEIVDGAGEQKDSD